MGSQDGKPPNRLSGDKIPAMMTTDEQVAEGIVTLRQGIRLLARVELGVSRMMALQEDVMSGLNSLTSSQEKRDRSIQKLSTEYERIQGELQRGRQIMDEQTVAFQQLTEVLEKFSRIASKRHSDPPEEETRIPTPAPMPIVHIPTQIPGSPQGTTPSHIKELRDRASHGDDVLKELAQMGIRIAEQRANFESKLAAQREETSIKVQAEKDRMILSDRKAKMRMKLTIAFAVISLAIALAKSFLGK